MDLSLCEIVDVDENDGEDIDDLPEEDLVQNGSTSNEETANENNDVEYDSNFVYKRLLRNSSGQSKQQCAKEERAATIRKVSSILQKPETERTSDDALFLNACGEIVKEVQSRRKKRDEAKRRQEEFEEPMDSLKQKCTILAQAIAQSQHLVVYTGAGISTAARIPDYRGTNGIWTMLQQGKSIGNHDLSLAEPTYTHMALSELYKRNILKYVVSQNCDGLHLRSGLPRTALSEVHGNMYMEVCKTCKPSREYWRLFDVTENTGRYSHKTMRKCYVCNGPLVDTIVHFGERGSLQWPLNWSGASKNARKATTIVCLGSSLKVLKKYPWLWQMHKPAKRRPNLYIVNLQWTPKDDCANVKIHGKCDVVMEQVMELLGLDVPQYERTNDPIFVHGTYLLDQELHTTTQPLLKFTGTPVPGRVVTLDDCKRREEQRNGIHTNKIENDNQALTNGRLNGEIKQEDVEEDDCNGIHYGMAMSRGVDNCDKISNIYAPPVRRSSPAAPETEQNEQIANVFNLWSMPQIAHQSSNSMKTLPGLEPACKSIASEAFSPLSLLPSEHLQSAVFQRNCQALLTYYQLSNSILQGQFGLQAYRDILYPLQTGFLYSGLHSIINPNPFGAEAQSCNGSEEDKPEVEQTQPDAMCGYCHDNYKSLTCVFYEKLEPGFVKREQRFSKSDNGHKDLFCLCCDFSTEEEDDESTDGVPPDKVVRLQGQEDVAGEAKAKIQPGWYGKGYKKNRKHRRKTGV